MEPKIELPPQLIARKIKTLESLGCPVEGSADLMITELLKLAYVMGESSGLREAKDIATESFDLNQVRSAGH